MARQMGTTSSPTDTGAMNRKLGNMAGFSQNRKALSQNDINLGHRRFYAVQSLKIDIEEAVFKLKVIEGVFLKPFTITQMKSLNLPEKVIAGLCKLGIDYSELSCSILAQVEVS